MPFDPSDLMRDDSDAKVQRDKVAADFLSQWEELRTAREPMDNAMLSDLRQYLSEYDDEELRVIRAAREGASELYAGLTRTKVRTMDARVNDMALSTGKRNWSITATPVPELEGAPTAADVSPEEVEALQAELAAEAAGRMEAMQREMEDHLVQDNYQAKFRRVTHHGHKYGWGILKGPLFTRSEHRKWVRQTENDPETGMAIGQRWRMMSERRVQPHFEVVSPWDYYTDWSSFDPYDSDLQCQRHAYRKATLQRMAKRPGFFADAIANHLANAEEGDVRWENWENEMWQLGQASYGTDKPTKPAQRKRWEVIEVWGNVGAKDLERLGLTQQAQEFGIENSETALVDVHLWIARNGGTLLGAQVNPNPAQERPYHFYVPMPEDGSVRGSSVPGTLRNAQRSINAFERMLHDNAAGSVLPQIELRLQRLIDASNFRRLYPGRVWAVTEESWNASAPALSYLDSPNHTAVYLAAWNHRKMMMDEASGIPSYQHGGASTGVGRTASGLSMLMGAAGLLVKDQLGAWDEFQSRVLKALYNWEMAFNPDESIKGDFNVQVKTTMSMLQAAQQAEQLRQTRMSTLNDRDSAILKPRPMLEDEMRALDQDPDRYLKSAEELMQEKQDMMAVMAAAQAERAQQEMGPPGMAPAQQPAPGEFTPGMAEGGVVTDPDELYIGSLRAAFPNYFNAPDGERQWMPSP